MVTGEFRIEQANRDAYVRVTCPVCQVSLSVAQSPEYEALAELAATFYDSHHLCLCTAEVPVPRLPA